MGQDLQRPGLGQLDWAPGQRAASLRAVFEHALSLAVEAESWYARQRPSNKFWGRLLRVLALLLGIAAAVVPILSEITKDADGTGGLAPGWSAIALALAAGLVALDHYFGFSNAWTRFMAAELQLTRLRHDLEYTWNARLAKAADPPEQGDVDDLVAIARSFVLAIDDAIVGETGQWVTDFQEGLQRTGAALAPGGAAP